MSETHQFNHFSLRYSVLLLSLSVLFLINCASRTGPASLPVDSTDTFSAAGTAEMPERWWISFDDESLNSAVDSALTANFDLRSAWERLQAARAVVKREQSFLIPDLSANGQAELTQPSSEAGTEEMFRGGLAAEYEIDLWGRIRSGIQAEQFRAHAAMTDYQAAAITLSAEVARTWFRMIEARQQLVLVRSQIETNEKVLDLIKARFGSGQIRSADILRQRQLLESTREQEYFAETELRLLENRFAVLQGNAPLNQSGFAAGDLPSLSPLPDTGIPVELIKRRPDVQSAYHRLRSADKDLATAISNQYPRLSITASVSSASQNADNLFEDWARSFAGNIFAPILYGGELRAEVDRSQAVRQQRLYEYAQTVLIAFREVEDALVRERNQVERIRSLEAQSDLAQKTYEQLRIEYFNGLGDYLDVLTALDQEQQLRRDLLTERLNLLEYRIALYRALAGGFETSRETADAAMNN